jgi:Novel STAND NTPase 1
MTISAAPAAPVSTRHSPYQGLVPYTEADAEWFFGRDEWSEMLADNFRAYRITVLYGSSGVGKTSLLGAGMLRRLGDEAAENVAELGSPRFLPVRFSAWSLDDPLAALRGAVREAAETTRPDLAAPSPEGALADVLAAWPELVGGQLLVVLDQLEELFAYRDRPDDEVVEELTAALRRRDPAVHFLLSIREDALASLDRFKGHVSGLGEHLLRLEHLDRNGAQGAIVEPLERWNRVVAGAGEKVEIEPPLVEAVLEQVTAGKVSLGDTAARPENRRGIEAPYLQLVLTRLWDEERRSGSRVLRLQTLERLGSYERISIPRSARCRHRTRTSSRKPFATSSRPRERRLPTGSRTSLTTSRGRRRRSRMSSTGSQETCGSSALPATTVTRSTTTRLPAQSPTGAGAGRNGRSAGASGGGSR